MRIHAKSMIALNCLHHSGYSSLRNLQSTVHRVTRRLHWCVPVPVSATQRPQHRLKVQRHLLSAAAMEDAVEVWFSRVAHEVNCPACGACAQEGSRYKMMLKCAIKALNVFFSRQKDLCMHNMKHIRLLCQQRRNLRLPFAMRGANTNHSANRF
jgi:hypothetical protein